MLSRHKAKFNISIRHNKVIELKIDVYDECKSYTSIFSAKNTQRKGLFIMNKKLVAFFSASGTTKKVAEMIAEEVKADLFEIEPKVPYTKADLDWMNKKSRSSVEMSDKKYRPAIMKKEMDMSSYDEILLGFPIWWYVCLLYTSPSPRDRG